MTEGRLTDKTTRPTYICCLPETHLRLKDTQTKIKRMEKDISCKWKGKKGWGSNTYIRQTRLKTKAVVRDKEGHYIVIKGTIEQEGITLVNVYTSNIRAPKYAKQTLMDVRGETAEIQT